MLTLFQLGGRIARVNLVTCLINRHPPTYEATIQKAPTNGKAVLAGTCKIIRTSTSLSPVPVTCYDAMSVLQTIRTSTAIAMKRRPDINLIQAEMKK